MTLLLKGEFLVANIQDVKLGTTQVNKIYCGDALVFEKVIDTTAPITSPRPFDATNNPTNTYDSPQTVYLDVNEPSNTYYTLDGTTPTTASTLYTGDGIYIDATTTFKYFSVDDDGNTEAVKTTTYTINATTVSFPRYIRFIGYGDSEFPSTTRLVELQAMQGATNRLLNKLPISGETPNTGAAVSASTDGIINHASGTYPIWWVGEGVPTLTYDLGDWYDITEIKVVMMSSASVPRATRFILQISDNNTNWTEVANYSTNNTIQPETGWTIAL